MITSKTVEKTVERDSQGRITRIVERDLTPEPAPQKADETLAIATSAAFQILNLLTRPEMVAMDAGPVQLRVTAPSSSDLNKVGTLVRELLNGSGAYWTLAATAPWKEGGVNIIVDAAAAATPTKPEVSTYPDPSRAGYL